MFLCVSVWECVWPLTQLHLHSNELHSRWSEGVRESQNLCMCVWGVGWGMIAQHQHVNEHQLWTCILTCVKWLYFIYIPKYVLFKCMFFLMNSIIIRFEIIIKKSLLIPFIFTLLQYNIHLETLSIQINWMANVLHWQVIIHRTYILIKCMYFWNNKNKNLMC